MGSQVNEKKERKKKERKKEEEEKRRKREQKKGSKVFTLVDIEQVRKTSFSLQSLLCKNFEEFLLCKHCKEGASVATQFLTHVLINFQKNPKITKNIENPKNKYVFNTF